MNVWLQFAFHLAMLAATALLAFNVGYRKGRMDEFKEWGKDDQ